MKKKEPQIALPAGEPTADLTLRRCFWCNRRNPRYVAYHDREWGVPCRDERRLYESFLLETFQAGLSWECVLNKRENFRAAFAGFNLERVCAYDEAELAELLQNPGLIRNRAKLRAGIRNSRIYRDICGEYGGFAPYLRQYLRQFSGGAVIREPDVSVTVSPLAEALSADLKKRGMSFVGAATIYAFLQAVGIVNGHTAECFLAPPADAPEIRW